MCLTAGGFIHPVAARVIDVTQTGSDGLVLNKLAARHPRARSQQRFRASTLELPIPSKHPLSRSVYRPVLIYPYIYRKLSLNLHMPAGRHDTFANWNLMQCNLAIVAAYESSGLRLHFGCKIIEFHFHQQQI